MYVLDNTDPIIPYLLMIPALIIVPVIIFYISAHGNFMDIRT